MAPRVDKRERFARLVEREEERYSAGYLRVAGVDEAGRGPLAGPVVAAAVMRRNGALPVDDREHAWLFDIFDSKQLSAGKRGQLCERIMGDGTPFHYGVAIVDHGTIDRVNILQATFIAMREAVGELTLPPDFLLVDGAEIPGIGIPQEKVIKGDATCLCIAAASILAKVTRDRLMEGYDAHYPAYGFARHKGYGTAQHLAAIRRHGRCALHRASFLVAGIDGKKRGKGGHH